MVNGLYKIGRIVKLSSLFIFVMAGDDNILLFKKEFHLICRIHSIYEIIENESIH